MTNDDLKQFRGIIKEELKPLEDRLGGMEEKLERVEDKVDALSGDVEQLLMDVKGIRDRDRDKEGMAHSRNKREIDEIKRHVGLPLMSDIPE